MDKTKMPYKLQFKYIYKQYKDNGFQREESCNNKDVINGKMS